jgi:hypothetical protein
VLQFLIVLAILAIIVLVVSAPIRRARMADTTPSAGVAADVEEDSARAGRVDASEVSELEAARDAKYREIRDAELDHRTGKLSDADFEAVDRGLRAEAIQILHELDRARGEDGGPPRGGAAVARTAEGGGGPTAGDAEADRRRRAGLRAEPPGSSRI